MRVASVLAMMGAALAAPNFAYASACQELMPPSASRPASTRLLNTKDLVRLRDIGPVENNAPRAAILAPSPDGHRVAFQLRQADPDSNDYCLGMAILDLAKPGAIRLVDVGGQVIIRQPNRLGFAIAIPAGTILTITPKWSPDGRQIAYLRRDDDRTELWTADVEGIAGIKRTRTLFDVEDFAWAKDGATLIFSGRPGLIDAQKAIDAERTKGWLFDDRFVPVASALPLPRDPIPVEFFALDLKTGALRPASNDEQALLRPSAPKGFPPGSQMTTMADGDRMAWVETDPDDVSVLPVLHARVRQRDISCHWDTCGKVFAVWWAGPSGDLIYLRRDGELGQDYGLYRWRPGEGAPRLLVRTTGIFEGCQPMGARLICGQETALQPREIVGVDLTTGAVSKLFDPNPEFAHLRLGQTQRLTLTNALGLSTWADLVLPPTHQPGQRHPLIIVEYESRGFLRGGTGDEYPIQAYASAGFAVLSFQRPPDYGYTRHPKTNEDADRLSRVDWVDRRSVLSLMEDGVRQAVEMGVANPDAVGLTGLSDGSSAVQFAAINSKAFHAFALSSCCDEESVVGFLDGPAGIDWIHAAGYPLLNDPQAEFWKDDSIRVNAAKIDTPILALSADREYLGALEGVMALQQAGKPVEMRVFPDEYHIRWQPAHRLSTYDLTLDWFRFWLMQQEDPDPGKAEQYRRWRQMQVNLRTVRTADSAGPSDHAKP